MAISANSIDWQSGLKDAMWSMFWLKNTKGSPDNEADKEALKESVAWLIRATTQKVGISALDRGLKDAVDWKALDTHIMNIVCCATSLCLHGEFGEMPEFIEGDKTDERQDFDMRGRICVDSNSIEDVGQECANDSGLDSQRENKGSQE